MAGNPKFELQISSAARRDIGAIMQWSLREFGSRAAVRYDALLSQALSDLLENPERAGSQPRADLGKDIRVYHLSFSRRRAKTATGTVHDPRHFLIYRIQRPAIQVLRVLHEARDLKRHIPEPTAEANK